MTSMTSKQLRQFHHRIRLRTGASCLDNVVEDHRGSRSDNDHGMSSEADFHAPERCCVDQRMFSSIMQAQPLEKIVPNCWMPQRAQCTASIAGIERHLFDVIRRRWKASKVQRRSEIRARSTASPWWTMTTTIRRRSGYLRGSRGRMAQRRRSWCSSLTARPVPALS